MSQGAGAIRRSLLELIRFRTTSGRGGSGVAERRAFAWVRHILDHGEQVAEECRPPPADARHPRSSRWLRYFVSRDRLTKAVQPSSRGHADTSTCHLRTRALR